MVCLGVVGAGGDGFWERVAVIMRKMIVFPSVGLWRLLLCLLMVLVLFSRTTVPQNFVFYKRRAGCQTKNVRMNEHGRTTSQSSARDGQQQTHAAKCAF